MPTSILEKKVPRVKKNGMQTFQKHYSLRSLKIQTTDHMIALTRQNLSYHAKGVRHKHGTRKC